MSVPRGGYTHQLWRADSVKARSAFPSWWRWRSTDCEGNDRGRLPDRGRLSPRKDQRPIEPPSGHHRQKGRRDRQVTNHADRAWDLKFGEGTPRADPARGKKTATCAY